MDQSVYCYNLIRVTKTRKLVVVVVSHTFRINRLNFGDEIAY